MSWADRIAGLESAWEASVRDQVRQLGPDYLAQHVDALTVQGASAFRSKERVPGVKPTKGLQWLKNTLSQQRASLDGVLTNGGLSLEAVLELTYLTVRFPLAAARDIRPWDLQTLVTNLLGAHKNILSLRESCATSLGRCCESLDSCCAGAAKKPAQQMMMSVGGSNQRSGAMGLKKPLLESNHDGTPTTELSIGAEGRPMGAHTEERLLNDKEGSQCCTGDGEGSPGDGEEKHLHAKPPGPPVAAATPARAQQESVGCLPCCRKSTTIPAHWSMRVYFGKLILLLNFVRNTMPVAEAERFANVRGELVSLHTQLKQEPTEVHACHATHGGRRSAGGRHHGDQHGHGAPSRPRVGSAGSSPASSGTGGGDCGASCKATFGFQRYEPVEHEVGRQHVGAGSLLDSLRDCYVRDARSSLHHRGQLQRGQPIQGGQLRQQEHEDHGVGERWHFDLVHQTFLRLAREKRRRERTQKLKLPPLSSPVAQRPNKLKRSVSEMPRPTLMKAKSAVFAVIATERMQHLHQRPEQDETPMGHTHSDTVNRNTNLFAQTAPSLQEEDEEIVLSVQEDVQDLPSDEDLIATFVQRENLRVWAWDPTVLHLRDYKQADDILVGESRGICLLHRDGGRPERGNWANARIKNTNRSGAEWVGPLVAAENTNNMAETAHITLAELWRTKNIKMAATYLDASLFGVYLEDDHAHRDAEDSTTKEETIAFLLPEGRGANGETVVEVRRRDIVGHQSLVAGGATTAPTLPTPQSSSTAMLFGYALEALGPAADVETFQSGVLEFAEKHLGFDAGELAKEIRDEWADIRKQNSSLSGMGDL